MKKAIVVLTLLAGTLVTAAAQDVKVIPAYWVVETNVKQKNFSIVRMYDDQHNLIHEVKMDGVYLNVSKVKHRKMLDQLLKGYYPITTTSSLESKEQVRQVSGSVQSSGFKVQGLKFECSGHSW